MFQLAFLLLSDIYNDQDWPRHYPVPHTVFKHDDMLVCSFIKGEGVPIEKVSKVLNHSAPAITMRYLGITSQGALDTYDEYEW